MGEKRTEKEENEFVSKVEELAPTEEVYFEPTPGFGQWAKFFPEAAKAHPAKANLNLINFLILEYTKPGDVILDPMAGTYSTCVLAVLNGRHGIGVELEEKFYKWGLEAKKIVESSPTVVPKGKMVVLQGDARKLSEILKQVDFDAIITSPPYTNCAFENPNVIELQKKGWVHGGDISKFFQNPISEDNLENLPFGNLKSSDEEYKMITRNQTKEDNRKKEERETYLEAMLKIYGEMFKILRHGGRAIIIVRPFVRGKRPIDLPYHTWLLLQKVGFRLEKLYKLRLKNQSFWRILYYKRHPDAPRICHEYILICRKPSMP